MNQSRGIRQCITVSILFLIVIAFSGAAAARSESEIKAAYLYNFIKFITWPDEAAETNINLCILGDNPFGAFAEKFNTLKTRNRAIKVSYPVSNNIHHCSIVFISPSEENLVDDLIHDLEVLPILMVSDIEGFIHSGGTIGFIKQGNIVRFDINLKQARSVGLNISAKLLKLANEVTQ